eukprot:scaffold29976_cov151-Isochrysis_galbana.AAC.4
MDDVANEVAELDDSWIVGTEDVDALWGDEGAPDDGIFATAFGFAGFIGDFVLAPARVDGVESERSPAGGEVVRLDILSKVAELVVLDVDGDVH